MAGKKRLLSGVKPTGRPHIGNYFGMMRQCVDLQYDYESFIFIPDLHALISVQNREDMQNLIRGVALDYLGIGIDPKHTILFKHSDVPAHPELTWMFDCITTMPYLMRAHAFKDAEAKNKEISIGMFNYPMLMAADILLYDADIVPVGQDQKQHVEYARDTAEKFNRIFGKVFAMPEALIKENVAIVPGIDGRKMSKSYNNTIPLFATKDEISKSVMGIVTDSSGGKPEHVYAIHKLFKTEEELAPLYETHKGQYKNLKEALIEDIEALVAPMRQRRAMYEQDLPQVDAILKSAGEKAHAIAELKMEKVRDLVGMKLY